MLRNFLITFYCLTDTFCEHKKHSIVNHLKRNTFLRKLFYLFKESKHQRFHKNYMVHKNLTWQDFFYFALNPPITFYEFLVKLRELQSPKHFN